MGMRGPKPPEPPAGKITVSDAAGVLKVSRSAVDMMILKGWLLAENVARPGLQNRMLLLDRTEVVALAKARRKPGWKPPVRA